MTASTSDLVKISEEGPREGFQSEPAGIPTSDKIQLIEALAQAGLCEINCCSFVGKAQVPQMADAEEIIANVKRKPGVLYTGLWLNLKGFERAQSSGVDLKPTLVTSASETFGIKNNNRNRSQLLEGQRELARAYKSSGLARAVGYVFTAFGCNYEGEIPVSRVVDSVRDLLSLGRDVGMGFEAIYLCDTIGSATPRGVRAAIDEIRSLWPDLGPARRQRGEELR